MFNKQYKNNKGFTIIEVLFAAVLTLLISISLYTIFMEQQKRILLDEMAYTTAQRMFTLSQPAITYIDDHIDDELPNSFTLQTLIKEGYADSNTDSNLDKTPLGRNLVFYVNNDNGFPLSIALYTTGNLSNSILVRYGLDNNFSMLSFERRVATYLQKMFNNKYSAGVVSPDYNMSWVSSNNDFNLDSFIRKNQTKISSQYSTALFLNLQENPGYWVLNYNSTSYIDVGGATSNGDKGHYLYSMGYSDFCPSPSILPNGSVTNSNLLGNIIEKSIHDVGNMSNNSYICLPASKIEVNEEQKEYSLNNDYVQNIEKVSGVGSCELVDAYSNIIEFKLGSRYYTFRESAGRAKLACYKDWNPVYVASQLQEGKVSGSQKDITLNFSNYYQPNIEDISINRINLTQ